MFWQITKKDLLIAFRDRSSWFILLLMPIVLMLIFTAVFGTSGSNFSFFPVNVVVANLDEPGKNPFGIDLGAQFMSFLQSPEMQEMLKISTTDSKEAVVAQIKDGTVQVGIIIPAGFSNSLAGTDPVTVEVLGDVGATVIPGIVRSIVDSYITILEANRIQFSSMGHVLTGGQAAGGHTGSIFSPEILQSAAIEELPVTFTETVEEGKKPLAMSSYYAAAMAVMFLLFTGNLGIFSLLEERENRTMLRLKTASLDKTSLIIGKFLAVVILGLIQIGILIGFTSIVIDANWGQSLAGLVFLTLAGVSSIAALSVLIAAVTKSSKAANAINWVAIQALAFLGGSFIPLEHLPRVVQVIGKFTVNGQALSGYMTLMQGGTFFDVLNTGLILFGTAIVSLALGSYLIKYGEEGV